MSTSYPLSLRLALCSSCCVFAWLVACDEKPDESAADPALDVPALGVLELPISLRTSGAAPSGASLELTPNGIRLGDKPVLALASGRVPEAEQADGVIPKLKAALSGGGGALALAVHSALPYETAALALNTAKSAGIRQVSFKVRKGTGTDTGWLEVKGFTMTPRTDDEVPIEGVDPRDWDDFAGAWQAVYDACRGAQTGSCAYVQENVAKGGKLKIVLHAVGQGVNLNFFRVGVSAEQLQEEEAARQAELAKKKEDVRQGRSEESELEQELLGGPPASQALFQFRAREALSAPSPVSATLAPLCGSKACGAVVSADAGTLMVRVVSLIGAAFPDETVAPQLAFEMPWTPAPKAPPPQQAAPAAPTAE